MRDPAYFEALARRDENALEAASRAHEGPVDITRDVAGFTALVRNATFAIVRALARYDLATAKDLARNADLDEPTLDRTVAEVRELFGTIREDAEARSPKHLVLHKREDTWDFEQGLVGDEGPTGYVVRGKVDLEGSRAEGHVVLRVDTISSA
jgi:hypothetical protein